MYQNISQTKEDSYFKIEALLKKAIELDYLKIDQQGPGYRLDDYHLSPQSQSSHDR